MGESLKDKTISGSIWSFTERFSVQGLQFAVMIIMARILTPADYGIVGMITIFLVLSQSLVDSGFSQALIRKLDRSETDNSTAFYFNIAVGGGIYLILYFCAPLIARFYETPQLTSVTRLISLSIVFNSLAVVQRALFTVNMDFKTMAKASLSAAVLSGAVGIYLAHTGFGVMAIVAHQLTNTFTVTLLFWILSKWRPKWTFSMASFRELFGFGSKLMISGLLDTGYRYLYNIVIGKLFKPAILGYYTRAQQFSEFASTNISGIIQRVSYPVLCSIQNDKDRLLDAFNKILKFTVFMMFPLLIALTALSKPLIVSLLSEKWIYAANILVPLSLAALWQPMHALNLLLLQVKGRSDIFLRLEIIKKCIGIAIIACTIPFGVLAMCWGMTLYSTIELVINTHWSAKLFNLGLLRQLRAIYPILLTAAFTGIIVYLFTETITLSPVISLCTGIVLFIVIYAAVCTFTAKKEMSELKNILSRLQRRSHNNKQT